MLFESNVLFSERHRCTRKKEIQVLLLGVEPKTFWSLVRSFYHWATGDSWELRPLHYNPYQFLLGRLGNMRSKLLMFVYAFCLSLPSPPCSMLNSPRGIMCKDSQLKLDIDPWEVKENEGKVKLSNLPKSFGDGSVGSCDKHPAYS